MKSAKSWVNSYPSFFINKEINTVPLKKTARFKVALIYPNSYYVGMSNLGLQSIYDQLNKRPDTLCCRFFYDPRKRRLLSLESRSAVKSFDIVAFSISFEGDYLNFFRILSNAGLLEKRAKRQAMPLILTGGVVNSFNFLPLSKFNDLLFVGEAEDSLPEFMDKLAASAPINSLKGKNKFLNELTQIEGIFIPGISDKDKVKVRYTKDLNLHPTSSKILTPLTEFSNTFLVEISRGCPWRCNFCVTGAVFDRYRPRNLDVLKAEIEFGLKFTSQVGLVGAAISDYPEIEGLVSFLRRKKAKVSVSSLRMNSVTPELLSLLSESGQKTVTFAPEAGSQSLRQQINKKITDEKILEKINLAKKSGIKKIKLYFMIGLPREEEADILEILKLVKSASSILPLKLNLGIFVPKPKMVFSEQNVLDKKILSSRLKFLRRNLGDLKNIEIKTAGIKAAEQAALFSKADEGFFENYLRL